MVMAPLSFIYQKNSTKIHATTFFGTKFYLNLFYYVLTLYN